MTDNLDALDDVDFPQKASTGALHRLYELQMYEETHDLAKKVLKHCLTRWEGLSPRDVRTLLQLEGGRFVMRFDSDHTVSFARWVADDVFLEKTIWTENWYDVRDVGDVEYELKGSDSVGHYLSHLVCSHQNKMVLFRENHFNEDLPDPDAIDDVKGDFDLDALYATEEDEEEEQAEEVADV
jgi:hypothetical protein